MGQKRFPDLNILICNSISNEIEGIENKVEIKSKVVFKITPKNHFLEIK